MSTLADIERENARRAKEYKPTKPVTCGADYVPPPEAPPPPPPARVPAKGIPNSRPERGPGQRRYSETQLARRAAKKAAYIEAKYPRPKLSLLDLY